MGRLRLMGQGGEHLRKRSMVGGVYVDMRVPNVRAGADHECGTELIHSSAALLDAVAIAMGAPRSSHASGIEQQRCEVDLSDGGRAGRRGIIVNEDGERDPLIDDEGLRVAFVSCPDRHDFGAGSGDFVVGVSQLRGMF